MPFYTYEHETPGVLFSCTSRGREADVNETVRMYLKDGKFDNVPHVDAKILTKTPAQVWDRCERRYREGYVYELQIETDDLPEGVNSLDYSDVKEFGCPLDVNVDITTVEVVTNVKLVPSETGPHCFKLQQTKKKYVLFGEPTADPETVTTSEACLTDATPNALYDTEFDPEFELPSIY